MRRRPTHVATLEGLVRPVTLRIRVAIGRG